MEFLETKTWLTLAALVIKRKCLVGDIITFLSIPKNKYEELMADVKELGSSIGIKIIEDGSDCVSYRVTDDKTFDNYYKDCYTIYYSYYNMCERNILNRFLIIEMLLTADDYIKTDEIAAAMNYSKSFLRNDLKDAKNFLNSYHIKVIDTPYRGFRIDGSEFDYRLCLTNVKTLMYDPGINAIDTIILNNEQRQVIYTMIIPILKNYGVTFQYERIHRLIIYILIQKERINSGHMIKSFANFDIHHIKQLKEFKIARNICKSLALSPLVSTTEEISSLAILIQIWQDHCTNISITNPLVDNDLYHKITAYLINNWGIDFTSNSSDNTAFLQDIIELSIKKRYYMLGCHDISIIGRNKSYINFPIIQMLNASRK